MNTYSHVVPSLQRDAATLMEAMLSESAASTGAR
jgi:hypothetical protein